MAPSSRDDQQKAGASRTPDTTNPGNPSDHPQEGSVNANADQENEPVDFGAFVSRSVRSSSDRLRRSGDASDDTGEPSRTRRVAGDGAESSIRPKNRSRRYWRDSLHEHADESADTVPGGSRRFLADEETPVENERVSGGGIGEIWTRFIGGGDDGEGPNRPLIAWFLAGLLVMLLVIFLLIRIFGGGGGSPEATPTPTETVPVIVPPGGESTSTPMPTLPVEAPAQTQETQPQSTETPEVIRGGDNQIGGDRGTPESGRQGTNLTPAVESPLAKECTDRCLVRVEADNLADIMEETGNRPSFYVNDLAWVVATPTQVSLLDERADVAFVEKGEDTLALYVVQVPADGDSDLVDDVATVLDESGPYRLARFDDLPARVSTLVDKGFDVHKLAPAPVSTIQETGTQPIADVSGGELMGQVSDTNIASDITTLQSSGSTDGTGMGSRYYTYGGNQIAADFLYQKLESFGLEVWYEEFLTPEGILLVNVVAEVPGRDESAVYAVMAHLDSINVEASPATAPGADDNSTGMAATLEMARILAQYQLEHPVRFVFTNAEEVGLLGSTAWAKRANAENVPIVGVFNIDSVGSDRQGRLLVFNSDTTSDWMQDLMISVNDNWGLGQEILTKEDPKDIVADDNMVREQGIDAVMIARELYGWSPLHHSARDIEEKVSIENVMTTTYLVMLSIVSLVG